MTSVFCRKCGALLADHARGECPAFALFQTDTTRPPPVHGWASSGFCVTVERERAVCMLCGARAEGARKPCTCEHTHEINGTHVMACGALLAQELARRPLDEQIAAFVGAAYAVRAQGVSRDTLERILTQAFEGAPE